jgi:oxygen-independent coproporphyrinogen-3 oxidase
MEIADLHIIETEADEKKLLDTKENKLYYDKAEVEKIEKILRERFDFSYEYEYLNKLPSKLSVSDLYPKVLDNEENSEIEQNISIDIIFGVSGFGGQSLERTLQQAVETGVEHISAYHLTIEPQTRFGRMLQRGEIEQVSESVSEQEFDAVHQLFTAAGYEHYEVSNFAKEGYRSRHNSSYWTGAEYLGIGPGAHSYNGTVRRWCEQDVEQYVERVEYGSETLTALDALNEYVMVSLRRVEGIDLQYIAQRWGDSWAERIASRAERFLACGWLCRSGSRVAVPVDKFLISDSVIAELFE